ncbi:MAG: phosphoribosyltransferase [Planctomycetia bacterium]|nr:phosphoribosyltransferase [Planctomycetia bacterium]
MNHLFFTDREQAGWMLVERLRAHDVGAGTDKPLVLAIPRGGVEVGAALARGLGTELDVVLSRKLRAPHQPELALGAVSETGEIHLNHFASAMTDAGDAYVEAERKRQMEEIGRRKTMFRAVRPQAEIRGRTVIVTDDGLATGATMIAALRTVRAAGAKEIVVAVPVAAPDRLDAIRPLCDRIECLAEPADFWAVGQFYRSFEQVSDERVCELLRDFGVPATKWTREVA